MVSKIKILSTAPLHEDSAQILTASSLRIEVIPFIETKPLISKKDRTKIELLEEEKCSVIFTSSNAVNAVKDQLKKIPDWKIYCIQGKTSSAVSRFWAKEQIIGTADYGKNLGEKVVADKPEKVVFFCGNKRLDVIPELMQANNIEIEEVVVYETIPVPRKIGRDFHGILFFSPSAVDSFFTNNTVPENTVLFAIGNTTKAAISAHTNNNVITADFPDKKELLNKLATFFKINEF